MRHQRTFGLLLVAVLALAAGYFFGVYRARTNPLANQAQRVAVKDVPRLQAITQPVRPKHIAHPTRLQSHPVGVPAPLPPGGTPLEKSYAQLKALADAGDAQAAARLFHEIHRCASVHRLNQILPQLLPVELAPEKSNATPGELKVEDSMLAMLQDEMDFARASQSLCENVSDTILDELVPQSLQAAQAGDNSAMNCYLGSDVTSLPNLLNHPEWLTQFKHNALELAQQGVQRGDWTVVGLLQHAYAGVFQSSLLGQLTNIDPVESYRYLQLQRLGASGDFATRLDDQIAAAAPQLTATQITYANLWASDTYARYFNGSSSNVNSNGVNICQIDDD